MATRLPKPKHGNMLLTRTWKPYQMTLIPAGEARMANQVVVAEFSSTQARQLAHGLLRAQALAQELGSRSGGIKVVPILRQVQPARQSQSKIEQIKVSVPRKYNSLRRAQGCWLFGMAQAHRTPQLLWMPQTRP